MAFSRFLESDVYVFEHVGGFIQCCGCWLSTGEREGWAYDAKTPREMIEHLDKHEAAGHDVDIARVRIIGEYENLDAPIPVRQRQTFRDVGNGE
jgi:hypothetical protein